MALPLGCILYNGIHHHQALCLKIELMAISFLKFSTDDAGNDDNTLSDGEGVSEKNKQKKKHVGSFSVRYLNV